MNETRPQYMCPMHPTITAEQSGICPECGMMLIPDRKRHADYNKHAGHSTDLFMKRFWINLLLTIPVVLYSDIFSMLSGIQMPLSLFSQFISLTFGSIIFFYGGAVFITGAWRELRARLPGMMTLIAIAIITAYVYSVYTIATDAGMPLFWELTTLITIMLLGHWIEMRAVSGAQGALKELSKLLPDKADILQNNEIISVPLAEIKENDIAVVKPGGRIPADGIVVEGASDINESMVTGESALVAKRSGSNVIAGTVNGDGFMKIRITNIGEATFLAGVMRLVRDAQASKSRLQLLSDTAAFYLTLIAIGGGIATLIVWLIAGAGTASAIERMVAVLIIACPHALGLAVPLVASISTTRAARHGFLVRQRLALEAARNIDVVLFDKTGTLTKGEYGIIKIWTFGAHDENALLVCAASVDIHSEHAIARAIVAYAQKHDAGIKKVTGFERIPGKGVKGVVDGRMIFVGGHALLDDIGLSVPPESADEISKANSKGMTIIYTASQENLLGVFALGDIIREESRQAVSDLKVMGVDVAMITGDSEGVAAWVAEELGIGEYFARVLPAEKSQKVFFLQKKGKKVAMVGDGINDAPALTQANVGIAIGAGTNVAIESAGIILMRNDPRDIAVIIRLSRLTYTKMLQNIFWATGYNIIALPLAAGVLASYGIVLQPAVGAFLMSSSTVVVAVNALLLRRTRL